MRSSALGTDTSPPVEVTNIDAYGIWLLINHKEHFLPYDEFPWFKSARIEQILDVVLIHEHHLHWPSLDVDLTLESLERPDKYPLRAAVGS